MRYTPTCPRWILAVAVVLATLQGSSAVGQAAYTDFVVFGDSLSDVGNTANNFWISLFAAQAQPPYYAGRFSDGPIWAETLAGDLGLNASTRSSAGGHNYAEGGALSGDGTNILGLIDNVGNQIDHYLDDNNPTGGELYVLWAGGNDLIEIGGSLGEIFSGGGTPQSVSSNTAGHVQTLAAAGAQHFLVLNLPDLGAIPRYAGTGDAAAKTLAAQEHNTLLTAQLASVRDQLGVTIAELDMQKLFGRLLDNPALYGFTNVSDPAYNESTGVVVANPDEYAFWDEIHPTSAAHDWIAAAAYVELQAKGDFTADGEVDAADLNIVLSHWGKAVTPFDLGQGDWTGDGVVDSRELGLVLRNWTSDQDPVVSLPEPGGLVLLGLGFVFLLNYRCERNCSVG